MKGKQGRKSVSVLGRRVILEGSGVEECATSLDRLSDLLLRLPPP